MMIRLTIHVHVKIDEISSGGDRRTPPHNGNPVLSGLGVVGARRGIDRCGCRRVTDVSKLPFTLCWKFGWRHEGLILFYGCV